jgi:hypothetical protein
MRRLAATVVLLLGLFAQSLTAQAPASKQKFHIAIDTAGVMETGENIYTTWVFALATPTSWPSSGILVAFDCKNRLVKRLAHVVYSMKADGDGVEGPIVEDQGEWQQIAIPEMFELVCRIGPTHGPSVVEPTYPKTDNPSWRIS